MNYYEGYIRDTGALMVVKVPDFVDNIVDHNSVHTYKYLGKKMLPSLNQANKYFQNLNGGKKYIDVSQITKSVEPNGNVR